jgi:hypothetical protein
MKVVKVTDFLEENETNMQTNGHSPVQDSKISSSEAAAALKQNLNLNYFEVSKLIYANNIIQHFM